jgi:hypothetical protein
MPRTVRSRFVAIKLAAGWIECSRRPVWIVSDGTGSLSLTTFPVAEGVRIDLEMLRALEHERRVAGAEFRKAIRRSGGTPIGRFFVDETTWSDGGRFCVGSTERLDTGLLGLRGLRREWTVSDGAYVLQATLSANTDNAFGRASEACEEMVRSIRFEGPS